ncbi:hypothetical protein ACM26W_11970 [Halomonas sp. HK25]|uniref:hypothetical protein n=1 Tax=Halomonas sp. HK25 TaxID=3394321 RepID=UPI0039FBCFF8
MYAIEFEADIRDGLVKIPERYARVKNGRARIVVLIDEGETPDTIAAIREKSINFSDYQIDTFQDVDGVAWQREQRDAW